MDERKVAASRIKLEVFALNDEGAEISVLSLDYKPVSGGGDGTADCQASTSSEEDFKSMVGQATRSLVEIVQSMPPGTLGEVAASDDLIAVPALAGEGVEYVKHELPYGRHMVMLSGQVERLPDGRVKRIKGEMRLFQKTKSSSAGGQPEYSITHKGKWRQIKNIDEYVEKHKLIVYKANV